MKGLRYWTRPLSFVLLSLPVQILHNRLELTFTVQLSFSHNHGGLAAAQEVPFLEGMKRHPAAPFRANPSVHGGKGETRDAQGFLRPCSQGKSDPSRHRGADQRARHWPHNRHRDQCLSVSEGAGSLQQRHRPLHFLEAPGCRRLLPSAAFRR